MTHYSVQPRDWTFVKGHGYLSFARNMSKNISKNLSSKYSQKLHDHVKQPNIDAFKTASKRTTQKVAEATGDSIENWKIGDSFENKIAYRITRVSKTLPKNDVETNEEEILLRKRGLNESTTILG